MTAPLWEAVALSLNMDPDGLYPPSSHVGFDFVVRQAPPEFQRRLALAANHLENGHLAATHPAGDVRYSEVDLPRFAAWAEHVGWGFPAGFPRSDAAERGALSKTPSRRRGRPKGAGALRDDAFLEQMRERRKENPGLSVWAAAGEVAPMASGGGTPGSKQSRLDRKYRTKFPE